ncbi:hypothetical protein [Streptomyces sp. SGAir0957]
MNEAEADRLRIQMQDLLRVLPHIVDGDARRIDHEIKQALTDADFTALRRVLDSDSRLAAWVRERESAPGEQHRALPSGYQGPPGSRSVISGGTVYVCLTAGCAVPGTFVRRNRMESVPACPTCNQLLSRAPS